MTMFPLSLVIIISYLFSFAYSESKLEYVQTLERHTYPVTTHSAHYSIELNYPKAFEITIQSYNGQEGQQGFCHTLPSKISTNVMYRGAIVNETASNNTDENAVERYYDNIIYSQKFYFILDSISFNLIAIKDFNERSADITIVSDHQNDMNEDGRFEDTYMVLGAEDELLFIVTRKKMYYYNLTNFFAATFQNLEIPHIQDQVSNYMQYDSLVAVESYKNRLYIVADNIIDVFVIGENNTVTKDIRFDAEYFGTTKVFLTSVAFKGNYVFVLDKFKGVYLIDLSNVNRTTESLKSRYWFQADKILEVSNGQFINIIGDCLHVISAGSKTPTLREYHIMGDSVFNHYEFNRQTELYQSIRDTYSDGNFLYLLTGYFNVASKYGVPGRYNDTTTKEYLDDYWPLFGTKAIVSSAATNLASKIVAIFDNNITVFKIFERNPMLYCNMQHAHAGYHRYQVRALQKDCTEKTNDKNSDFNSICVINQELELDVIKGSANIGNVTKSKKTVIFLAVGIGLMFVLVIVFIYLFRKYRNQFRRLEDEVRFQKLEEEGEEQGEKKKEDASPVDIQVELGKRK